MTPTSSNTFKVGVLFFVALIVLGTASISIGHLDLFKRPHYYLVEFKNVGGLKEGDSVRVSGLELGRVDKLVLGPGYVTATLRMYEPMQLRENYEIAVAMSSLVGGRHIAVEAGDLSQPELTIVENETKLHGTPPQSAIDEIGQLVKENRQQVKDFIANLNEISASLKNGKGTLGLLLNDDKLYHDVEGGVQDARAAIAELKKAGGVIADAGEVVKQIKEQLASGEGTLVKLFKSNDVYDSLKGSADKLAAILEKAERGEGTIGKLLNDDSFYTDAKALVSQMNSAVTDLRAVVEKINNGQGAAGRLINDEKLGQDLADAVADAKAMMASVKSIAEKIDTGNGSISKLLNESSMYDKANEAIGSINTLVGGAARTKTYVTIGSRYYASDKIVAPFGYLRIYPTQDRYLELGGVGWLAGEHTPWEFPEKTKPHEMGKFFFKATAMLGFTFMDNRLDLAAGLLEGKPGGRISYRFTIPWIEHDVTIATELREAYTNPDRLDERAGKMMTRIYADTKLWKWFHAQVGVSRVFHNPEVFAGLSFTYEDEDIRSFISLIGLAK